MGFGTMGSGLPSPLHSPKLQPSPATISRPLRIEFPGAIYHVTSRGDRREPIYRDDDDRRTHLAVLEQAMDRFDAAVLAYCQMGNHFHMVLQTRRPNLSRLMRHLNGVYTQAFNRRHGLVGHLFQGRFKAILVDGDSYLLALCRYVERNPVAAGLAGRAAEWPWSSAQAHLGAVPVPSWLDVDTLHGHLLGRPVASARDRRRACALYLRLVEAAAGNGDTQFWQTGLRGQIFLGDDTFAEQMRLKMNAERRDSEAIPKVQRVGARTWEQCLNDSARDRDRALWLAYRHGGMTMTALASAAGISRSHVSRLIARQEKERWET